MKLTITLLQACVLAFLLPGSATGAAPTLPPVAHFFDNPAFRGAALSPSGRHLAAVTSAPGMRARLMVVDLADFSATLVAQFGDLDVGHFQWVNDNRLLFDTFDATIGRRDRRYGPGLFAVNRDGKGFRQLAMRKVKFAVDGNDTKTILPYHTYMLDQIGAQNSDAVFVENVSFDDTGVDEVELLRLDTVTGRSEHVPHPGRSRSWLLDHLGQPRIVTTLAENISTVHYRDPATQAWRALADAEIYTGDTDALNPLGFGADGTLYVVANVGKDTASLYRYDLAAQKIVGNPVVELKGFDFEGALITNSNALLGVRVNADADGTVWFNDDMKKLQSTVDGLLPTTVNLITVPVRAQSPWVLVDSYSDHQPHIYRVFNKTTRRLSEVGSEAPLIRPADMAAYDQVQYTARDGLPIPAWLTTPRGSGKNLPLVLLVHGGPFVRGSDWGWHAQAQFLASRGYAVLEPEFRGSTGYGDAHFRAGWKQWGLKMQDDLADAVKWAVAQGIADPRRVCIAGGSYGGYATLMGLVNDPDLYRCGINWIGVTDIGLMYDSGWANTSDMPQRWKTYGMPQMVGDLVKDAGQLTATSPLKQAARIRQPLLLAYGGADVRVPLVHGTKFLQAVKAANKDVEWIEYPEEGHGWYLPKNRIDFWTRVEKFLERNIGKP